MRIKTDSWVPRGTQFEMADYDHPEISLLDNVIPDGRLIVCHPDDEQKVRDRIALEQERTP